MNFLLEDLPVNDEIDELLENVPIEDEIDELLEEAFFNGKKKKQKEEQDRKEREEQDKKRMDAKINWGNEMLRKAHNERNKLSKNGYRYVRLNTRLDESENFFDLLLEACKTPGKNIKTIVLDKDVDYEYYTVVSYIKQSFAKSLT